MEASASQPRRSTKAKAAQAKSDDGALTFEFELDRETPGAVRFAENAPKGTEAYIRTFYMRKELWEKLDKSEVLEITVRPL